MLNTKRYSKNDLAKFYNCYPLFKKYCQYNLWSEEFSEFDKVKYCEIYVYNYIYSFTENFILQYFDSTVLYTLYNSSYFLKNIKSVFIKHIDYHFLLFFQYNLFLYSNRSSKEIELFVEEYFFRYIKKTFEKDLFRCVVKSFNDCVPVCFLYNFNNRLNCFNRKVIKVQLNNPSLSNSNKVAKYFFYKQRIKFTKTFNSSSVSNRLPLLNSTLFEFFFNSYLKSKCIADKSICTSITCLSISFSSLSNLLKDTSHARCLSLKKGYNKKLGYTFSLLSLKNTYLFFFFETNPFFNSSLYTCCRCWFFTKHQYTPLKDTFKKNVSDISLLLNSTIEGLEDYDYKKNDVGIPTHSNIIIKKNLKSVNRPIDTLSNFLIELDKVFIKRANKMNEAFTKNLLALGFNSKNLDYTIAPAINTNYSFVKYSKKGFTIVWGKYTLSDKIFEDNPKKTLRIFDMGFQKELEDTKRPLKNIGIKFFFFNQKAFRSILLCLGQVIEHKYYEQS